MKILILGGSGMLGHRLWINLQKEHEVWVTIRQASSPFPSRPEFPVKYIRTDVDASNFDQVTRALASSTGSGYQLYWPNQANGTSGTRSH